MYALSIIGNEYNKKSNSSIKGVEIVGKWVFGADQSRKLCESSWKHCGEYVGVYLEEGCLDGVMELTHADKGLSTATAELSTGNWSGHMEGCRC